MVGTAADEQLLLKIVQGLPPPGSGRGGGPLLKKLQIQRRPKEPRFTLANSCKQMAAGSDRVIDLVTVSDDTAFNVLIDGGADYVMIIVSHPIFSICHTPHTPFCPLITHLSHAVFS